ncbi:ABC transporter related [Alloactinosynnema sp. L-07]|uniref:ABC transporter permease n=1 Tax=Alloactinosynnema sp. L-07 TaxID=1653480 RepID=UPI00065F0509|nr:ABC transporter permease [Alloactinosynnema sp. L-07]CRK58906.1 ABC transporter related [Alloactinosynnema sp. L-07]
MALSGRFRSALIIGGQGIRARKLRTFLSMISLFLGVLAVVAVQASAEIANRAMLSDIELTMGKDGTRVLQLPTDATTGPVVTEVLTGRSDAVAAISTMGIIGEPRVAPINPGGSPLKYAGQGGYGGPNMICDQNGCREEKLEGDPPPPGQAIEMRLIGLTGDIREFRPFRQEAGRWLDFTGEPSMSPGLVLNREAAAALTQYRIPAELRASGAANPTPRILGVIHDGDSGPVAYVRADELATWTSNGPSDGRGYMSIFLRPEATDVEQTIKARLIARGADAEQMHSYPVEARKEIESELRLMKLIFLAMAALVLLIGVAGILNVGLATVGERIEEFALRRAVGTPRLLLAGIVLAETLIIGLLTAAAAVGTGIVGLKLAGSVLGGRFQMLEGVDFPWQAGIAGVIAGLAAGVLGGLLPAIRAARIPIATVMRA